MLQALVKNRPEFSSLLTLVGIDETELARGGLVLSSPHQHLLTKAMSSNPAAVHRQPESRTVLDTSKLHNRCALTRWLAVFNREPGVVRKEADTVDFTMNVAYFLD